MNEARIRSRYIRMHAFFSCLHCHRTDPICVTYEQKIGIGSHLTDSVNEAFVDLFMPKHTHYTLTKIQKVKKHNRTPLNASVCFDIILYYFI